ncbi:MAG: arginine deiminase-related protein [Sphingomonadales bacterium]|jgi:N-dimethylarginine dimethylaminohydrolase
MELETAMNARHSKDNNKSRLFMCPPDYFEVTYQINPWMSPDEWGKNRDKLSAQAKEEWENLKATYERLGHEVITIDAVDGLPDMVFTANSGIVLNGTVLLAHFRHPQRQGEEKYFARFFEGLKEKGLIKKVVAPKEEIIFEGAGDAVWDPYRKLYWVGFNQRSDRSAVDMVADVLGQKAIPLEMVSEDFYHLDVALAPLSRGHLIYIADAFDEKGFNRLKELAGEDMLVPATAEDAEGFGVNAVNLGDDIITAHCSDDLRTRLEALGYNIHICPLETFKMSGGGAFCLTLKLDYQV